MEVEIINRAEAAPTAAAPARRDKEASRDRKLAASATVEDAPHWGMSPLAHAAGRWRRTPTSCPGRQGEHA